MTLLGASFMFFLTCVFTASFGAITRAVCWARKKPGAFQRVLPLYFVGCLFWFLMTAAYSCGILFLDGYFFLQDSNAWLFVILASAASSLGFISHNCFLQGGKPLSFETRPILMVSLAIVPFGVWLCGTWSWYWWMHSSRRTN